MDLDLYHVDTLREDGTWGVFTKMPIESEGDAQARLDAILEFARKVGRVNPQARLRRLTQEDLHREKEDLIQEMAAKLPRDAKDKIVLDHLRRMVTDDTTVRSLLGEISKEQLYRVLTGGVESQDPT